jgi:hypothetical protein
MSSDWIAIRVDTPNRRLPKASTDALVTTAETTTESDYVLLQSALFSGNDTVKAPLYIVARILTLCTCI